MSKISELSDGGSLQSTDYLIAVRSGGNVKVQPNGTVTGTTGSFSGNVVIGATSVSNPNSYGAVLNVEGYAPALVLSEDTGRDYTIGVNGNNLNIFNETTNVLTIADSGNVGIGGAPASVTHGPHLDIVGGRGTLTVGTGYFEDNGTTNFLNGARPLAFGTGGTEAARLDASGNVVIGATTAAQRLHVSSAGAVTRALIENTNNAAAGAGIQFITKNGATQVSNATLRTDNAGNFTIFTGTTGETERMRIDSSGSLMVGTTSSRPAEFLHPDGFSVRGDVVGQIQNTVTSAQCGIFNRDGTDGEIFLFRKEGTAVGSIGSYTGGDRLYIGTGDTGVVFADSIDSVFPMNPSTNAIRDAAIDLGTSTGRFKDLYLSGDANSGEFKATQGTGAAGFSFTASGSVADAANMFCPAGFTLAFGTNNSEAMRIDSSGNLLVGTTETDIGYTDSGSGFSVSPDGYIQAARSSGNELLYLNKLDNDGAIVRFSKDGAPVGGIGVNSGVIPYFVRSAGSVGGIALGGGATKKVFPCDTTGSAADNAMDLGDTATRWKDLYLSGGVYLGGTGAANLLDDYETGTFTPSMGGVSGWGAATGTYTKIGNTVHAFIVLTSNSGVTGTATNVISGLPFSSDLTERTSNVSVARMFGVALTTTDYIAGIIGTDIIFSYVNGDNNVNNFTTSGSTLRISLAITYTTAA